MISTTYSDLVKTIGDSAVTTTDLSMVASDEAAIQTDLGNLPRRFQPVSNGLLDLEAGPSAGLSLSSAAISLPIIIVGPSPVPITLGGGSVLAEASLTWGRDEPGRYRSGPQFRRHVRQCVCEAQGGSANPPGRA